MPVRGPKEYLRDEHPTASELVAEHEVLHTAHKEAVPVTLSNISLSIHPGVFRPDLSMMGQNLVSKLAIRSGETVLDLGTGSGFQAILAAGEGAKWVLAVDKQPEAVTCAKQNVDQNGLAQKIEVRESDLFSAITANEKFDVILFNFPFPPFEPQSDWQEANFDPGHQLLTRFLCEAKGYLNPDGRIGMCWSDIGDTSYLRELVEKNEYDIQVLDEKSKGDIGAYIFELRLS